MTKQRQFDLTVSKTPTTSKTARHDRTASGFI